MLIPGAIPLSRPKTVRLRVTIAFPRLRGRNGTSDQILSFKLNHFNFQHASLSFLSIVKQHPIRSMSVEWKKDVLFPKFYKIIILWSGEMSKKIFPHCLQAVGSTVRSFLSRSRYFTHRRSTKKPPQMRRHNHSLILFLAIMFTCITAFLTIHHMRTIDNRIMISTDTGITRT